MYPFLSEHLKSYAGMFHICLIQSVLFFSILLDSTSDSSHVSCNVLPLRQVQWQFVKFLEMGHSASQMLQSLTDLLLAKKIDIKDCRGQSHDDASNMSGKSKNNAAMQSGGSER